MFGNRAIYNDGWIAATTPAVAAWVFGGKVPPVDDYKWELYNVDRDFSESNNLATEERQKLRELQDLFWVEAAKYNVLRIDNSRAERSMCSLRRSLTRGARRHLLRWNDAHTRRQRARPEEQVVQHSRRGRDTVRRRGRRADDARRAI